MIFLLCIIIILTTITYYILSRYKLNTIDKVPRFYIFIGTLVLMTLLGYWVSLTLSNFLNINFLTSSFLKDKNVIHLIGFVQSLFLISLVILLLYRKNKLKEYINLRTAQLQASEEKYRQLTEIFPETIFECNLDGKLTYANEHAYKQFGYTKEDFKNGLTIADMLLLSDPDALKKRIKDRIEKKITGFQEYIAKRKDKSTFPALGYSVPIIDNGNIVGFRGFMLDNSKQKDIERIIRESESLLAALLSNLNVGVFIINSTTATIEKVNKAAIQMYGASEEALIGIMCKNFCHLTCNVCPLEIDDIEIQNLEAEIIRIDGTRVPVLKSVKKMNVNGTIKLLESFVDLSERKKTEEALKRSEYRYRLLLNSGNDAIFVHGFANGKPGKFTEVNQVSCDLLGYSQNEFLQLSPEDLHCPIDNTTIPDIESTLVKTKRHTFVMNLRHKDGSKIPTEISSNIVEIDNNALVLSIARDIRDRQRKEQELINARLIAEDANKAKSNFLASMSHEIRTPLNGIVAMAALLADANLPSELQRYAGIVRGSAHTLLSIINDILDFSKIEAGKLVLECINFDLRALMSDLILSLSINAHQKGLEINYLIQHDVPSLLVGDPNRIRQILSNLIGNAIKFTSSGDVSILVEKVNISDSKITLKFIIRDTGIGINEEQRKKLFSPFSQADGSITRKYGGTGLGLVISKQLAEMMGGSIDFTSQENLGSKFWFTITLEKQAQTSTTIAPISNDSILTLRGVKLLLIDDNPVTLDILANYVDHWGFRYCKAHSGHEALTLLREAEENQDPFRAALIDAYLPDANGIELGSKFKVMSSLKLILLTPLGLRGDGKEAADAGFDGYLPKPIRPSVLFDCLVMTLLGSHHPEHKKLITKHSIAESRGATVHVLVVEDNLTNQEVASAILKRLGIKGEIAESGPAAISSLKKNNFDLVFMDCHMPGMDGFETTQKIRDKDTKVIDPQIPIIAMTADVQKETQDRCLASGMNDFLSKPISPESMALIVDKWITLRAEKLQTLESSKLSNNDAQVMTSDILIDINKLKENIGNDIELINKLLSLFIPSVEENRDEMVKGAIDENFEKISFSAHSIKGAALNLCADSFGQLASAINEFAKKNDIKKIRETMIDFDKTWVLLKNQILQIQKSL